MRPLSAHYSAHRGRIAVRGRVTLRLRPGEAPEHVPAHFDVSQGASDWALKVDGGPVDRVLRRFSPALRATRTYAARRNLARAGRAHLGWDEVEQDLGLSRSLRVELDPDVPLGPLVSELRALAVVEEASAHFLARAPFATPTVTRAASGRWGAELVGVARALQLEAGDSALIIGVVDSGVAPDHPELRGGLRPGLDTVDLPADRLARTVELLGDRADRDRDPSDEIVGHGTACAGILRATGRRVSRGCAGAAKVLPLRALTGAHLADEEGVTALGSLPDIDAAVKAAVDLGARVLNLSFGTPAESLDADDPVPHVEVVRYAMARDCVLVAAAGNSGREEFYYPAALPGVIAVGGVGPDRMPAAFSTRGDHVALSAPSVDLETLSLDGVGRQSGTSFAAPFVAGAAALILARSARAATPLSAFEVRDLLVRSVMPFGSRGVRGAGSGVLDIPAALGATDLLLDRAFEELGERLEPTAFDESVARARAGPGEDLPRR